MQSQATMGSTTREPTRTVATMQVGKTNDIVVPLLRTYVGEILIGEGPIYARVTP